MHSLSLLTRRRRMSLVHELLWLTVGWSRLANCAVRRTDGTTRKIFRLLSNVNFCGVVDNKNTAGPIKRPSSSTNTLLHSITGTVASCYKFHRLSTCLRPLNYMVLFTTITRRFKVRPYSTSNIHQLPWRHQLEMVLWLNSQQNRLLQCKQWHEANASKCVRPFIGASDLRPYILYITYI